MAYTVKQLAEISGVSVRTLHWYDKKGLLKPSYIGANNYRYYEEEQLLLLQQILFFKELGFNLNDIQLLLKRDHFDFVKALRVHRSILEEDIDRINKLINTIDSTVLHLTGVCMITSDKFYSGFDSPKHKELESYFSKYLGAMIAEDIMTEYKKRTQEWSTDQWEQFNETSDKIYESVSTCQQKELSPECDQVQSLAEQYYNHVKQLYDNLTQDVFIGMAQLNCDHPDLKKHFEKYSPEFAAYLSQAMIVYAKDKLA